MDQNKMNDSGNNAYFENLLLQQKTAELLTHKPERLLFAKGTGAYGKFIATNDFSGLTSSQLFKQGTECEVFVRFSSMLGERGSSDSFLGIRGFAIKFFAPEGIWDLVCTTSPVSALNDASKFPEYLQAIKKSKETNLVNHEAKWDFYGRNPETLHYLLIEKSGRSNPANYQSIDGYSGNTYSFINKNGDISWVKFHIKNLQNTESKQDAQPTKNPDSFHEDLMNDIQDGTIPKWRVYIQTMSDEKAKELNWNPFDATKVWLHEEFPLMELGEISLNKWPQNYSAEVEDAAFSPVNVIDGIGFSPDPILMARMSIYTMAQRERLGQSEKIHPQPFQNALLMAEKFKGEFQHYENYDAYTQAGLFYTKALKTEEERSQLANNIIESMNKIKGEKRQEIIGRQLCHFFRASIELGMKIAMGLQFNIDANMMVHSKF